MTGAFEILKWDSDFFGFKVARILPYRMNEEELRGILTSLSIQDVSLVYWASDPDDIGSHRAATFCGGHLVDKKTTYTVDLTKLIPMHINDIHLSVETYHYRVANEAMKSLALQAGIYSRFNIDKKISKDMYEKLYTIWIHKTVERVTAEEVFIVRENDTVVGFISVGRKNNRCNIGLLAVDESMRGNSIGTKLVRRAQQWGLSQGIRVMEVVTQGDNIDGCRLYEKCGFSVDNVDYFYHFWL